VPAAIHIEQLFKTYAGADAPAVNGLDLTVKKAGSSDCWVQMVLEKPPRFPSFADS
jgi:hypothetical protein